MRNTFSGTLAVKALATTTVDTEAVNGNAVDTGVYGNNFRDVLFIINSGTLADGTYAVTVEESDASGSDYAAVDSRRLIGSLPAFDSASEDGVWKSFGVRPTKRYVRLVVTPTEGTAGGPFTATAVLGNGGDNPAARA
jgi:hypothetical protein